jgi:hypothetical protein
MATLLDLSALLGRLHRPASVPGEWVDSLAQAAPRLVGLAALGRLLIRSVVERVERAAWRLVLLASRPLDTSPLVVEEEPELPPATQPVTGVPVVSLPLAAPIRPVLRVVSPVVPSLKLVKPLRPDIPRPAVAVARRSFPVRSRTVLMALVMVLVAVAVLLLSTETSRVPVVPVDPAMSDSSG